MSFRAPRPATQHGHSFRRISAYATVLVALFVFVLLSSASASAQVKFSPRLLNELTSAAPDAPVQAVVSFHGDEPITAEQIAAVKALGITRGLYLRALPIMGVVGTPAQIRALVNVPGVRSVYPNAQLQYENAEATALTGVDRARVEANFTRANGGMPVSGKGVTVLVNDSGIDGTHADLQFGDHVIENAEAAANLHAVDAMLPITYVEGVPNTDLGGGHGTHVAGIVGATGARSAGKYEGAAPGASLVGYGSGAGLFVLDALGGFDYALVQQARLKIRVITNSWGDTSDVNTPFDPEDPINIASKMVTDRNIVVVFSAGNSGPLEGTISGNYKKAPWVICVANTWKNGRLEDSSSRGVDGRRGTVTYDGVTMTWEDRPTVAAPGTDIVSTRASTSSLQALSAEQDAAGIEPAFLPFYTHMTGTSMAAPHVAGVVALILDANYTLTPAEVKSIIQQTATNIPGYEAWEVGAGMVNAHAAVDRAFNARNYGSTLNMTRSFHANAVVETSREPFTIDFSPVKQLSPTANRFLFTVPDGITALDAWAEVGGVEGQTGNPVNLILIDPTGKEVASSGVSLLFPLDYLRAAQVTNPMPGNWYVELRGLRGDAANPTDGVSVPETVKGTIKLRRSAGYTGMSDIAGHAAEAAIQVAVNERLVDGFSDKTFRPDQPLTKIQLADYLVMSTGVRQFFPTNGSRTFGDVGTKQVAIAEAVAARGSNLRDTFHQGRGVVLPKATGVFGPSDSVTRAMMAYSLVQALGLEKDALARNGQQVTVQYGDKRVAIDDAAQIPAGLAGYVQLALDLGIMHAYFNLTQGPYDLQPTIHATFQPAKVVTRADYAVDITRYFGAFFPSE